jgi:Protein of unknown function (DUF4232)
MRVRSSTLAVAVTVAAVVSAAACGSGAGTATLSSVSPGGPSGSPAAPSPSRSASAARVARCVTSQLRITLTRTGGAVTGEVGGYLRFANIGAACRLHGWPMVVAVTATGKTVNVAHAVHGTMLGAWQYDPPLPVMALKPGASAYAVVAAGDHSAGSARRCPNVRWLRVTPPGGSGHVTLSAHLAGRGYLPDCTSVSGSAEIEVSAVVPLHDVAH